MRVGALVGLAAVAFVGVPSARADETSIHLTVTRGEGAEDCPGATELREALGRTAKPAHDPAETRYEITFSKGPSGYRGIIQVRGPRAGERAVSDTSATCVAVAHAAVLTLSLLLDEDAPAGAADPVRPPEQPRDPAPPRVVAPSRRANETKAAGESATVLFDAAAGLAAGIVRPIAPLLSAGGSWERRGLAIGLEALWIPTQALTLDAGTVDVSFVAGQASGCWYPFGGPRRVRAGGCFLAAAGVLHAAARGYRRDNAATRPWFGAGLALVAGGAVVGPLGWRARVGGMLPLTAEGFAVDNVGTAYDPPVASALQEVFLVVHRRLADFEGRSKMTTCAITGTADFMPYEVVLDVAAGASQVAFGLLLKGSGQAWMGSPRLEIVGGDVPTTD